VSCDGAHIDYGSSPFLPPHDPDGLLYEEEGGSDVDGHDLVPLIPGSGFDRSPGGGSCAVDQDVYPPEGSVSGLDDLLVCVGKPQVGGDEHDFRRGTAADGTGDLLPSGTASPREQHPFGAPIGDEPGRGLSDSGGATGDNCRLARE